MKMAQNNEIKISKISKQTGTKNDPILIPTEDDSEVIPAMSNADFLKDDGDWDNDNCDESVASSQEVFVIENSDENDSDEDFEAYSKKPSTSTSKRMRQRRSRNVYINAPINFTCAKCKGTFKDFDSLSTHMKAKNCTVEEFRCKVCAKRFATKKNMNSHMSTHRPKPENFICESCAMEFTNNFDLETHLESIHKRIIKRDCIYRCTHCHDAFHSHLDLLEHVKQHSKEKKDSPKLCEICAKECPNNRSYLSHVQGHKTRKTYVCDVSSCMKSLD